MIDWKGRKVQMLFLFCQNSNSYISEALWDNAVCPTSLNFYHKLKVREPYEMMNQTRKCRLDFVWEGFNRNHLLYMRSSISTHFGRKNGSTLLFLSWLSVPDIMFMDATESTTGSFSSFFLCLPLPCFVVHSGRILLQCLLCSTFRCSLASANSFE